MVNFLQRSGFSNGCITNLDNRDPWVLFNSVATQRGQPFTKVKAHCGKHDLCQDPFLTEGNSCADKLAKDTAWAFIEKTRQQTACEELALAMSWQTHLATRSSSFKMLPVEIPAGHDFFLNIRC